ncbi:MAG: hypoxanthine phosphoribosyltransferase [Planctomycetota bacterium]|nr:MAG: hypoxanthine phosphoribosyltransferase [Planctomycetota bacterium]
MKQLLTAKELEEGVDQLAARLRREYLGRPLTVVGVLTGSIVLLADLIRRLDLPLRVGLIQARSYRGAATTPGELTVNADLLPDVKNREVLLLDDIFDTGHTLERLLTDIRALGPISIRSAVLLRKEGRSEVDFEPDYVVFEIPDAFVVGYGLDFHDAYRNLPYVAALDDEIANDDLDALPPPGDCDPRDC